MYNIWESELFVSTWKGVLFLQTSYYPRVGSVGQAAVNLSEKAKENRTVLTASFLFGFLAHGFAFTNKLVNHDEVASLFIKGATVESGRFGLGLLDLIFPNCSMPWIYGILSIAMLAVAVCFLVNLFEIRSSLLQVLFAGVVLSFPALTGTFGYMFTSSSYALSFLLACMAIWLIQKGGLWKKLLALCLMVASLSIYQAYISLAAGVLVLCLLQELLLGEKNAAVVKQGVVDLVFLILSLGLYFLAAKLVLRITGTSFGQYAQSSIVLRVSDLPKKIVLAYTMFGKFFSESLHGLIPTAFSRVLHGVLALVCLILFLSWALSRRKKELSGLLLAALLLLLLPLAVNCMYLITAEDSIHTLVLYGFICVYLLPLILTDSLPAHFRVLRSAAENLIPLLLAGIVIVNTYIANQSYLNLHLRYENAHAFYTALMADLHNNPDFQEGTKLAVVGDYVSPAFFEEQFADIDRITGVHGFLPDGYAKAQFLNYYIGLEIPVVSDEQAAALRELPQVQQMPCYPYYGSVQAIDGVLVVKLS